MILLPKYRDIILPNRLVKIGIGFSGEVRTFLYDLNMNLQCDSGWSPNLIVDIGLDKIWESGNSFLNSAIGSGNTPATNGDTTIETLLGTVDNSFGVDNGLKVAASSPNWEYSKIISKRYPAGIGTGTIRETTMGYGASGTNIFSRIILPSPIVKSSIQILDVLWRITVWPDLTDHISTAVFKGITYDTITRVRNVGSFNGDDAGGQFKIVDSGTATWVAWDGAIGPITGSPAGTKDNGGTGDGFTSETYVNGNFYRDIRYFAGLEDWVLNSNIRCLSGAFTLLDIQTQFTEAAGEPNPGNPVPKDNTEIMDFGWRYTWGRH